jgi:hypothetical protein
LWFVFPFAVSHVARNLSPHTSSSLTLAPYSVHQPHGRSDPTTGLNFSSKAPESSLKFSKCLLVTGMATGDAKRPMNYLL